MSPTIRSAMALLLMLLLLVSVSLDISKASRLLVAVNFLFGMLFTITLTLG